MELIEENLEKSHEVMVVRENVLTKSFLDSNDSRVSDQSMSIIINDNKLWSTIFTVLWQDG